MRPVSIKTIAEATGYSVTTVSRGLGSKGRVAPSTRAAITAAAQRLGYRPNEAARSLVSGTNRAIGLIVPDISNPFYSLVFKGAQARARDHGYTLLAADSNDDPLSEADLVRDMQTRVGAIVLAVVPDEMTGERIEKYREGVPVVLLNRQLSGMNSVSPDMDNGIRQAVRHLQAIGHRSIAFLEGGMHYWSNGQRSSQTERAVSEAGLEFVKIPSHSPTSTGGSAALAAVLASGATAVIAFNDVMALGLMAEMRRKGLICPKDLSVVGIDNIQTSELSGPPLSTVGSASLSIGRAAMDLALDGMREGDPMALTFPSEFVARGSTCPPRGSY